MYEFMENTIWLSENTCLPKFGRYIRNVDGRAPLYTTIRANLSNGTILSLATKRRARRWEECGAHRWFTFTFPFTDSSDRCWFNFCEVWYAPYNAVRTCMYISNCGAKATVSCQTRLLPERRAATARICLRKKNRDFFSAPNVTKNLTCFQISLGVSDKQRQSFKAFISKSNK